MLGLRSPLAKGPAGVCWAGLACGTAPLPAAGAILGFCHQGPAGQMEIAPGCPHLVPVLGHSGSLTQGGKRTVGGGCEVTVLVSCFGKTTREAVHHSGRTEKRRGLPQGNWPGVRRPGDMAASVEAARMWPCGRRENPDRMQTCVHTSKKRQAGHAVSTSGSENKVRCNQIPDPTWCMNASPRDPPTYRASHA